MFYGQFFLKTIGLLPLPPVQVSALGRQHADHRPDPDGKAVPEGRQRVHLPPEHPSGRARDQFDRRLNIPILRFRPYLERNNANMAKYSKILRFGLSKRYVANILIWKNKNRKKPNFKGFYSGYLNIMNKGRHGHFLRQRLEPHDGRAGDGQSAQNRPEKAGHRLPHHLPQHRRGESVESGAAKVPDPKIGFVFIPKKLNFRKLHLIYLSVLGRI